MAARCDTAAAASDSPRPAVSGLGDEGSYDFRRGFSLLLDGCEHLLQPLNEERGRLHDAVLLRLHERARFLEILLPVGVSLHGGAALLALVEAIVGPQVDHAI